MSYAEVESANVVGYQNKVTRDGKELVTPTFQVVGGERGVWLSELKPTGYLGNSVAWWSGNITFTITIRDENGGIATDGTGKPLSYVWMQSFDYDSWENDGYPYGEDALAYWIDDGKWYFDGEPLTPKQEGSDYWVSAGFGLWLEAPVHSEDDLAADYTITYAGQVNVSDCTLTFRDGKNPMGNMFPVGIRLSSLVPSGYLGNSVAWWSGNIVFTFIIRDENGGIATDEKTGNPLSYVWMQSFDYDSWENDGYPYGEDALAYWINDGQWYFAGDPITVGGKDDPTFDPGQGLWVEAPVHSEDDLKADYTITFKSGVTL